jgi:glutamate--glyoxylate aminotransferase
MEMTNIHPGAVDEIYKCASINLSPNTMGQVGLGTKIEIHSIP